jgi:hypothetical protein
VPVLVPVRVFALMVMLVPRVVGAGLDRLRALNQPEMPVGSSVGVLVDTASVAMQSRCARTAHAKNRSQRDGAFMSGSESSSAGRSGGGSVADAVALVPSEPFAAVDAARVLDGEAAGGEGRQAAVG